MSPDVPKPRYVLPETISDAATEAARDAVAGLPTNLQTPLMHELMLACLYDADFRYRFRADPTGICKSMGAPLPIPSRTKLDVHENDASTIHLVLPGEDIRHAPHKGEAGAPRTTLAVHEALARGEELEISDEDLDSGPVIALLKDDVRDGSWKTADPKGGDSNADWADLHGGDGRNDNNDYDVDKSSDTGKD